jgi:2-polyprenyl-3-methyl-5-hydroxy-6-metoxy-1,4-benzoquinol methylase
VNRPAQKQQRVRSWTRALARRVLWRAAPGYARRRSARIASAGRLAHLESTLEHVEERHGERIARLEEFVRELVQTAEALRRGIVDVDRVAAATSRRLELLETELNALPYVAGGSFERLQSPVGEVLGYRSSAAIRGGGSGYVDFEELFRGPAARVAESQRPYLKLVHEHQPVLDVGCGRGEFLALMAGEGVEARGVDSDAGMVERCRALGLEATLADANTHLEGLEDGSLGTIFSAQLIEHLPHAALQRMFELARRKLRPGGLLIAETVNPHRIASLKTFWVDLTHQHPIFPEVALALSAIAGFESAYIFAPGFDSFERARFDSPAYALVAATSAFGSDA